MASHGVAKRGGSRRALKAENAAGGAATRQREATGSDSDNRITGQEKCTCEGAREPGNQKMGGHKGAQQREPASYISEGQLRDALAMQQLTHP